MIVPRLLWVGLAGCALVGCDHRYVEHYRGPAASENRELASFNAIEVNGDVRLEIEIGDSTEVALRGEPRLIKRTLTTVTDNILRIDVQRKDWAWGNERRPLIVRVSMPQLRSLELDGGNDVRVRGFKGGESTINVHGAARVRGSGELDQLTVHLAGAGFADLSKLVTAQAKVTVDGVGSVFVNPKQSLDATINGLGAILYTGKPEQVRSSMNGMGAIGQRDEHHDRGEKRGPGRLKGDWDWDWDFDDEHENQDDNVETI